MREQRPCACSSSLMSGPKLLTGWLRGVAPPLGLRDDLRTVFRKKQLEAILAHSAVAGVLATVFGAIIAIFVEPSFGATIVNAWFAAKVFSALPRVLLALVYKSTRFRERIESNSAWLYSTIALDGAIWGLAGYVGASAPTVTASVLIACLAVVATVATLGLQVRLLATAIFVTPILALSISGLLMRVDEFGFFAAGGLLLLLLQLHVTGFRTERRMAREFLSREQLAQALETQSATARRLEETGEQLRRQSAVKSLFLGTMSHELRTPLHGILGVAGMMMREKQDVDSRFRLGIVQAQGEHLLSLIGALLDVSRIETGRLELHCAPFDLTEEVKRLADLYSERTRETPVSFVLDEQPPANCWVTGDSSRVRQVLHNLLGNAVKFTRQGLIKLTVVRHEGGETVFTVADTGPGMSIDDQATAFEAFRQGADPARQPEAGTGLGLTIARELARAMGGDVVVHSVLGVGSRFEFSAVLPPADPIAKEPSDALLGARPTRFSGYRVLLAEDNDVNALIAEAILTRVGVHPTRVTGGLAAVAAASEMQRPHLILMDLHMPDMDGLAAAREIRNREKVARISRVPIVALTATSSREDMTACRAAGMDGFLGKPYTETELVGVLASFLGPGIPLLADENDDLGGSHEAQTWRSNAFH